MPQECGERLNIKGKHHTFVSVLINTLTEIYKKKLPSYSYGQKVDIQFNFVIIFERYISALNFLLGVVFVCTHFFNLIFYTCQSINFVRRYINGVGDGFIFCYIGLHGGRGWYGEQCCVTLHLIFFFIK